MWEFKNGIKLKSQNWVQSKVNLHKPKKKGDKIESNMVHGQAMNNPNHKTYHNSNFKGIHFLLYNILYD
jgi:hypothetical protein